MLDQIIEDTSQILQKIALSSQTADKVSYILVYATLFYCIVSFVILIGRMTGKVHNVIQIRDKVSLTLILLLQTLHIVGVIVITKDIKVRFAAYKISDFCQSYITLFAGLILLLLILFIIAFFIWAIWSIWSILKIVLSENWKANGKILGIFIALYDIVSGFFWTILAVAAFSFSIALIWVVIAFILLSLKTENVKIIDEDNY